jgi:hypothetical protein
MNENKNALEGVWVLSRSPGHWRLQIPTGFCGVECARALSHSLVTLFGMRRARIFAGGKLSLHFNADLVDEKQLLLHLRDCLLETERLVAAGSFPPPAEKRAPSAGKWLARKKAQAKGMWRSGKKKVLSRAENSLAPVKQFRQLLERGKHPFRLDPQTENQLILLLNEAVLLYVIRIHWEQITKKWMKNPLRHIGEWSTLAYLIFLYVRYKKKCGSENH